MHDQWNLLSCGVKTALSRPDSGLNDCPCPHDCDCNSKPYGQVGALSRPVSFYVELTAACNNRCPGCGNVFSQMESCSLAHPPLNFSQWLELLEQIALGTNRIKLTGGEPTLFPHFDELIRHLDGLGVEFTVFTNGRWANPEQLLGSLTKLKNFWGFLVSLHGPTPAIHERFCGVRGAFTETVNNIRHAVAAGLPPTVSVVIHRHNHALVRQTADLALSLGGSHVVFNRYLGTVAELMVDEVNLMRAVETVDKMGRAGMPVSFGNCIPQCFCENSSKGCSAGDSFCTVDPWGNVRPCNHAPLIVGNLLRQTIEEIWFSAEMESWRAMVPEWCADCAALADCHGGCRAMMLLCNETADPLTKSPLADYAPVREPIYLPQDAIPVGRFTVRQEPQGYLFMQGSHFFVLQREQEKLMHCLEQRFSVGQIESTCGSEVLPVLVSLYENGFVDLATAR